MEFKREFCSRWGQAVVGHVFKEKYNKQNLYHKCPKVNSGEVWTEDELLIYADMTIWLVANILLSSRKNWYTFLKRRKKFLKKLEYRWIIVQFAEAKEKISTQGGIAAFELCHFIRQSDLNWFGFYGEWQHVGCCINSPHFVPVSMTLQRLTINWIIFFNPSSFAKM